MYLLLKMVIFQSAMLVYQRVHVFSSPNTSTNGVESIIVGGEVLFLKNKGARTGYDKPQTTRIFIDTYRHISCYCSACQPF